MQNILLIVNGAATPLMLLSLSLAIASFVVGIAYKSKKWIPISCGIVFLLLILSQLFLWYSRQYALLGAYGLGKPEDVAIIVSKFLGVAFVAPCIAPLALTGTSIALFKSTANRVLFILGCMVFVIAVFAVTTRNFDRNLSMVFFGGRGEMEERLWDAQRKAYVDTLQANGVSIDPEDIDDNDNLPPSEVRDIMRMGRGFYEIYPPPSALEAILFKKWAESGKEYNQLLEIEFFQKYLPACEAEGIRLANERLAAERKD